MNLRNVLTTVALSAITALIVVWGYERFNESRIALSGQHAGAMPSNYKFASLGDGNLPPAGADFTEIGRAHV